MARLPNFLVIIRSEKLSGKGQGRGVGVRKKERFVLGKRTFRSQKSKHFVLRIIPFRERMHCTNNANTGSMREIDWEHGSPYIWQDHDYQTLINSNKIFARKFNSNQMGVVYKIQKLYLKQVPK